MFQIGNTLKFLIRFRCFPPVVFMNDPFLEQTLALYNVRAKTNLYDNVLN
jgi:hypothetical protein